MRVALAVHDHVLRTAVEVHEGWLFKHTGDRVCAAFDSAPVALAAAVEIGRRLRQTDWGPIGELRVRIGLRAGDAQERGGDWFGPALNRTARLMAVGHGGQVLLSGAASPGGPGTSGRCRPARLGDTPATGPGPTGARVPGPRPGAFAVVPAPAGAGRLQGQLPTELTSFLGRESDVDSVVAEVTGRSGSGGHRLVTLTGPGGVGKTRLAMQVAADAFRCPSPCAVTATPLGSGPASADLPAGDRSHARPV
jgi:hypothetical protein